jgi:hypothetical protein
MVVKISPSLLRLTSVIMSLRVLKFLNNYDVLTSVIMSLRVLKFLNNYDVLSCNLLLRFPP